MAMPKFSTNGAYPKIIDTTTATWNKLPDTSAAGARNYPAGWSAISLKLEGSKHTPPTAGHVIMFLGYYPVHAINAVINFAQGGTASSPLLPSTEINITPKGTIDAPTGTDNPSSIKLVIVNADGTYSGSVSLTDTLANGVIVPRKAVPFFGQVVHLVGGTPWVDQGYGFLLLPQLPDVSISPTPAATSTPILSGSVLVRGL